MHLLLCALWSITLEKVDWNGIIRKKKKKKSFSVFRKTVLRSLEVVSAFFFLRKRVKDLNGRWKNTFSAKVLKLRTFNWLTGDWSSVCALREEEQAVLSSSCILPWDSHSQMNCHIPHRWSRQLALLLLHLRGLLAVGKQQVTAFPSTSWWNMLCVA